MRPAVTFGDPEVKLIGYLETTALADVATISVDAPAVALGATKHVQVECDGTPGADYPITERATVRINCSTGRNDRSGVKALASLVEAYCYVWPGDAGVYGTTPLVGRSAVIEDPATGNLMVWFTFRLSLTPQPVA